MASKVVQFRVSEDLVEFLRQQGVNPNEAAKEAFEGMVRKARAAANYGAIRQLAKEQALRRSRTAAEIIRAERDSH